VRVDVVEQPDYTCGARIQKHVGEGTLRLIIVGCEYSGTTTIANAICRWAEGAMGGTIEPHDHFVIPHIACYQIGPRAAPLTEEEQKHMLALSPKLKEMFQRQDMVYHFPTPNQGPDWVLVGYQIADAVYGPMFFDYGLANEPQGGPRSKYMRHIEMVFLERAPETVLVYLKASPEVIARRMKASPHQNGVVREGDIQRVLDAFESEYQASVLHNKMTLDTSSATVEETVKEFRRQLQPYVTDEDRRRILLREGTQASPGPK
jgi:hypothetical protein